MTTSGDITIADGQGHVKLHPYLVTLVRWCVSCLWSTATVLLQRLMAAPLQPITGPKPPTKGRITKRAAGTEHLHPEPKVECQLLHQPQEHTLDVIFVHGLYGSLGNTWRQGDWRHKYQADPKKVTLRSHSAKACQCHKSSYKSQANYIYNENNVDNQNKCDESINSKIYNGNSNENKCNSNDDFYNITDLNDSEMTLKKINEKLFKKILPKENDLITEQFYNNTLLDQVEIVDNYETQAKFVRDLFKRENNCDNCDNDNGNKCKYERTYNECKCNDKQCEVGCGCVCDDCYSTCWPRDWIREDFPGARVISINYTSDPYLWRPLWIKENKRLSLHVRAEQMMQQLLDMGVGGKPIVWVGHSKGGLFIKQIYCKAYEAHQKLNNTDKANIEPKINHTDQIYKKNVNDDVIAETIDNIVGSMFDNKEMYKEHNYTDNIKVKNNIYGTNSIKNMCNDRLQKCAKIYRDVKLNVNVTGLNVIVDNDNICNNDPNGNGGVERCEELSSNIEGSRLSPRASLYTQSAGFMFYSVPHRGSPLADIKTPVTARSLELLEISKDCPLVLELQDRWLAATAGRGRSPAVRGFVETCRTLMSVLWLRIVSVDSADAGLGTLLGVSVDHREICKPSSRRCMLYIELTDLIHEALNRCEC